MCDCTEVEYFVDAEETHSSISVEPSLNILKDLHALYEERLAYIQQNGNEDTIQLQLGLLRRWVADLAEQNALLVQTVEGLETNAISGLRSAYTRKLDKDRELRRLVEDLQQRDETIQSLKSEVSQAKQTVSRNVNTKDVDVSVSLCCSAAQCGDVEPVRDYSALLKEESDKYEAKMTRMEESLKKSAESQCRLLKSNAELSEEAVAARRMCCVLDEHCRTQALNAQFKDDIIRVMRRQLKQAKAKLKEEAVALSSSTSAPQQNATGKGGVGALNHEERGSLRKSDRSIHSSKEQAARGRGGLERGDADSAAVPPQPPPPPPVVTSTAAAAGRHARDRTSEGDGDKFSNQST